MMNLKFILVVLVSYACNAAATVVITDSNRLEQFSIYASSEKCAETGKNLASFFPTKLFFGDPEKAQTRLVFMVPELEKDGLRNVILLNCTNRLLKYCF